MTHVSKPATPAGVPARPNQGMIVTLLILFGATSLSNTRALSQAAPSQAAPLSPDLGQVAKAYREQDEELRSLFVEYRHVGRVIATAEEALKHLGPIAMKTEETRAFAFKGIRRYSRFARTDSLADDLVTMELCQKESDGKPKTTRAAANSIRTFDGRTVRIRNSGGMSASIIDPKAVEHETDYFDSEYLSAFLRALPDAFNHSEDQAARRLASLINNGVCVARPAPELVDGALCVVIEVRLKSPLTLWCDPAIGYAVRRLEGNFDFDFGAGPRPSRTRCGDFVNVCASLWLPRRCETAIYTDAAARDSSRAPLATWASNVLEIHANDVSDEIFTLTIPEGTQVLDHRKGQNDLLGSRYATQYYMPAEDPDRANEPIGGRGLPAIKSTRGYGPKVATACILVAFAVLSCLVIRRFHRQKTPIVSPDVSLGVRGTARLPYHDV
jgi:hypothetical protein